MEITKIGAKNLYKLIKSIILKIWVEMLGKQLTVEDISYDIKDLTSQEEDTFIMTDFNRMESVFQNLITNSFHAFKNEPHKPNKKIQIDIESDQGNLIIVYSDNAGGMQKDIEKCVFDPFFTTKEVGEGTGLGMSISKQIIEECKGNISLTNIEGQGVEFTIVIPKTTQNKNSKIKSIAQADLSGFLKIKQSHNKILIVDDEPSITEILSLLLEEHYIIETFNCPLKALKRSNEVQFNLLLTDIKMPNMKGFELAEKIRIQHPNIRLIFMSGHVHDNEFKEMKKFQDSEFLPKPFGDLEKVVETIKKSFYNELNKAS